MKTFFPSDHAASAPSRTRWLRDWLSALTYAVRAGVKQYREERDWQRGPIDHNF